MRSSRGRQRAQIALTTFGRYATFWRLNSSTGEVQLQPEAIDVSTKTTCRITSNVDLLSRLQLDEVMQRLQQPGSASGLHFEIPEHDASTTPGDVSFLLNALLEEKSDAVVIDAATLPAKMPGGVAIGAILNRLTPYDALVCDEELILDELPENARVAANTAGREAQMLCYRPDLSMVRVRGSVDALLQKVAAGKISAAIVAAADVERLNLLDSVREMLTNSVCIPQAGQGALAVLLRSSDDVLKRCVQGIGDTRAYSAIRAEWTFLDALGVSRDDPVGVLGTIHRKALELEGVVAHPDGRHKVHFMVKGRLGKEEEVGRTLAQEILDGGGREILQELQLV